MANQWLKALQRTFGISAPHVAVHTHMPWYLRWLGIVVIGALVSGIGWATYDFGMKFAGYRQNEADHALKTLNETVSKQNQELSELRSKAAQAEQQLQIERATYGDLAKQVKALAVENATLKEDLAFFHSLMPAGGKNDTVTINRFQLLQEVLPGEYRYRLLLVKARQRGQEFKGKLQFVLNLQQDGRKVVLVLPPEGQHDAKEYQLNFKFFQRIEGTFRITPDAVVQGMQVRVFENGSNAPKLTQDVNLS
jgi:hypothetical protein